MADYSYGTEGNAGSTAMNLLRAFGGYSRPSGRGWFMFRALTSASSSAAIIGLAGASVTGYLTGAGAVGFIVASCLGFCVGAIHFYHSAKAEALGAMCRHPRLMQHHLEVNFPRSGYEKLNAEQRIRDGTLVTYFSGIDEPDQNLSGFGFGGNITRIVSATCRRQIRQAARQGQLMSAHQTAQESLIGIETQREQRIIEYMVESEKAREAASDA